MSCGKFVNLIIVYLFGTFLGKWWGPKNQRPILCVHGWQDNANSFNTLIPHLPPDLSYLAIDLPGHGLSSYINKGFFYKTYDVICLFRRLQDYFNWNKVSFMGHSLGAVCSFLFTASFPKEVNFFIALDAIKPLSLDPKKEVKNGSQTIEKLLRYETFKMETAPAYSKDDLLDRWIKSTDSSLNRHTCEILLERGTTCFEGLYRLTRDSRVKASFLSGYTQREILTLAKSISCAVLLIKAANTPGFERKKYELEVIEILKKNLKHFDYHKFAGTHHIHLNNPELIAPVISSFIIRQTEKN